MRAWWELGTGRIMVHFPSREENRAGATSLKCSFVLPSTAEGAIALRKMQIQKQWVSLYPGPSLAPGKCDMSASQY